MTKRIVFLADLHCGSKFALADPKAVSSRIVGHDVRREFYKRWLQCVRGKWRAPDILVCDGDALDGQDTKHSGGGVWTTDLEEQVQCAANLLSMWEPEKTVIALGSNYHVEVGHTGMYAEEFLGEKLDALAPPHDKKAHSAWQWLIDVEGVPFHIQHHVGVSQVWAYRSTAIARQMLAVRLNAPVRHCNTVRAHCHYYWECGASPTRGWILPCWQAYSPFTLSRGAMDIKPDIGFLGVEVDDGRITRTEAVLWSVNDIAANRLTQL